MLDCLVGLTRKDADDNGVVDAGALGVIIEVRKALVKRGLDYYSELAAAAPCRGQGPVS